MKCVALILAGGSGSRMDCDIPKQYINVYDKPILMYTLDAFERYPQVDEIGVVALAGWIDVTNAFAKQHGISKLKWVVEGGDTVQKSIYNGLKRLEDELEEEDIVIIHDGIRPLMDEHVLADVIKVAKEKGNAVSSMPYNEQIFVVNVENDKTTKAFIPRERIRRVLTPQAYHYTRIMDVYKKAFTQNIGLHDTSYADTLMVDFGEKLHFAAGSERNIKIINQDDLSMFRAYLKKEKDLWLK